MPIHKLNIEEFLSLSKQHPVLDVRSPGEYTHAHIPSALSMPLFDDEERKEVGTTYKKQSREAAIKMGLDYFGVKMRAMVETAEAIVKHHKSAALHDQTPSTVLVHCWRGGMRSAAIAWLLDLYGFKVYLLAGGYKAYRKWVLASFEEDYRFAIIGGYTGSGKTLLLHELEKQNQSIVDLEGLANHKGSAFGALENIPQPRQEMFENLLADALTAARYSLSEKNEDPANGEPATGSIYIEDESQRIGNLQLPMSLWNGMRRSPVFFIDIPFEERLNYITEDYGRQTKQTLIDAILRIQKRLGGLETKNAIRHLEADDYKECFRILLSYYDKWYQKGLLNREKSSSGVNKIACSSVDTVTNTKKILSCHIASTY